MVATTDVRHTVARVDLGALGLRLPGDAPLRWSIALRDDETAAPRAFDLAWLRVSEPDAAGRAAIEAGGASGRSAAFAGLGCYAEALSAAIETPADRQNDPATARALDRLAEQARLDPKLLRE